MSDVYRHPVGLENIQNARPDVISHRRQINPGAVVIEFGIYYDQSGIINAHLGSLAIVRGPAYRVKGDEIIDRGVGLGRSIAVEALPSLTKPSGEFVHTPEWVGVDFIGIEDIDTRMAGPGFSRGLLAVSQEPSQVFPDLEVAPGLYINGSNDAFTCFKAGFMAVALDSDPRLADQNL